MSIVDAGFRIVYRVAYQLMRLYWRVMKPNTHGALIAIWCDRQILLIRNSYVSYYCVPGGYLKRGETAEAAAVRELWEECAIRVKPNELQLGRRETHEFEGKTDTVEIFDLHAKMRPPFHVDGREVISAAFYSPEAALELKLFPPLRRHIETHLEGSDPPGRGQD